MKRRVSAEGLKRRRWKEQAKERSLGGRRHNFRSSLLPKSCSKNEARKKKRGHHGKKKFSLQRAGGRMREGTFAKRRRHELHRERNRRSPPQLGMRKKGKRR